MKTVIVDNKEYAANSNLFEFKQMCFAGWVKVTAATSDALEFKFLDDNGDWHNGICYCLAGNRKLWGFV
jgi:hypothetical protein